MNTFRFEQQGAIGKIVLVEPSAAANGGDFADSLRRAVRAANESDIRALIITSETGNFVVTKDVNELMESGPHWLEAFVADVVASIRIIEELRVPTIASVAGVASGGGLELLLACDFLVVAASATLYLPEALVGTAPLAGGVQRLAERIGRTRAMRMTMLAEPVTGSNAVDIGLATHLASTNDLEKTTQELAEHLVNGPTRSYAAIRSLFRNWSKGGVAGADVAMAAITDGLSATEDMRKGMAAAAKAMKSGEHLPHLDFAGK